MTRRFDSSSEFQTLFEGSPKLYLVLTPDFNIVTASDAYCDATFTVPEKILGLGFFDVFPGNPNDPTATGVSSSRASLERVLLHRRPDKLSKQKYDIPLPGSAGNVFEARYWSQVNAPILDQNDEILWIIHQVEDLTEGAPPLVCESVSETSQEQLNVGTLPPRSDGALGIQAKEYARLEKKLVARSIELQTEILERKKAEVLLRNESTFHNLMIENIPAMVLVKDALDFRIVFVNHAGEELLGMDRSELIGKSDYDFVPKEQADFFVSRDREVLRVGGLHTTPAEPIDTRNQGTRLLRTMKMAVPDDHGRPKYLLSISEDITEHHKTEAVLHESEARHRFLDALGKETAKSFDAAEILAISTRMMGEHLDVAICAYADMELDQDHFTIRGDWSAEGSPSIIGYYSLADFGRLAVKNLGAGLPLVVNDNLAELAPEEAATFQNIGIAATICMPLVKDGRLTALMAVHDRKPRIWSTSDLAILSEVTERSWAHIERVRLEVSVREGARQLVHAQKMEAIGNLTGGVAHDFNNLLGIIIGNLDLLRGQKIGGAALDPGIDQLASEALEAALRGSDLTKSLLAFARRQSLRPQRVVVNDLVEGISKLLSRTLGTDITIKLELGTDIWPVDADPSQLSASLINICNNARDAMPSGGILMIATSNRYLDNDYSALHPELTPGNYALIEISDTGTGIEPEMLNQIFEPFFTTKGQGKGTGLGLSMVFGFMKQSSGHITVYSEVGHGTTFRLYLPRATADREAMAPETVAVSEQGGHETVLAVEDNVGLRRVVVRQLGELGYRVLEAEDGNAALKILESEPVNLLFTDIMMPGGISGYDLALKATSRWPDLKVLLTSGYPETKLNGDGGPPVSVQLVEQTLPKKRSGPRIA